ncbi:hypothetical protein DH2020_009497 [Rehmannia glutinosa]|uniref:C3H1-type domain-containing protein n=1 Tax=Rehmannia glutinosa TaxID=99300 RepID=A0ABR0X999_REHGL
MENVVLESDENENHETIANGDGNRDVGGLESSDLLPLRPYAGDCPHFVRTGTCKFGLSCRYSHPVKKTQLFVKGGDSDSDNSGTIECKYFSTAGGCKYGKSCRYNHPGEESENTFYELNFLGLPMRLGEKECPYYMRNGSCAYGSRCVFHHPDPASVAGMESPYPMAEKFVSLSENLDVGSMHLPGMSKPGQASRSLHKLSYNVGPYSEDQSSPQWMGKHSEWNGYQASSYSNQSRSFCSTPIANGSVRKPDVPMQVDEFPERPGQLECDYFMKTGNCKFKSTCRFHHPKNRISMPDECVLNENGLPLRPHLCPSGAIWLRTPRVLYHQQYSPPSSAAIRVEVFVGIMNVMVFASLDPHACLTTLQPMDCQHIQIGRLQRLLMSAMGGMIRFTLPGAFSLLVGVPALAAVPLAFFSSLALAKITVNPSAEAGLFTSHSPNFGNGRPFSCCRETSSATRLPFLVDPQTLQLSQYITVTGCNNDCDIACCYCDIRVQPPLCVQCCQGEP